MSQETNDAFVRAATEVREPAEGDVLGTLGIHGTLFFGQLVNFLIVLVVLWVFAYKPLIKLMAERTQKIEQGLQRANEMEKRVEELAQEREQVMKDARKEAKVTMDTAVAQAKEKYDVLLAKAKDDVAQTVAASRAQLAHEKDQLMQEVRSELADIVLEAARAVARESVDQKKASKAAVAAIEQAASDL